MMVQHDFDFPGPYFLRSIIDGLVHDDVEDYVRVPTTLELIERERQLLIAKIHGALAARMSAMLREYPLEKEHKSRFLNCFGAVRFAVGSKKSPAWVTYAVEQGRRMSIRQAMKTLGLPAIFQICGQYLQGDEPEKVCPLHEGFLITGADDDGVILQKPEEKPFALTLYSQMQQTWVRNPDVRVSHVNWMQPEHVA